MGHSTGGLITSLWAGACRSGSPAGAQLAVARPAGLGDGQDPRRPRDRALGDTAPDPLPPPPRSGPLRPNAPRALGGKWDYDHVLKLTPSPPVRVGWLRAMLRGHQRVAAGSVHLPKCPSW